MLLNLYRDVEVTCEEVIDIPNGKKPRRIDLTTIYVSEITYEQLLTNEVQEDMAFKTTNVLACKLSNFNSLLNKMFNKLLSEEEQRKYIYVRKKSGLNFKCIDFPTPITQLKKFEKINN
ncbi:Uncharacterized protein FWK35_00026256, partial [Aphis craccivora]